MAKNDVVKHHLQHEQALNKKAKKQGIAYDKKQENAIINKAETHVKLAGKTISQSGLPKQADSFKKDVQAHINKGRKKGDGSGAFDDDPKKKEK